MRVMISYQCESQEEAQAVLSAVAAIGKEPHACSKQYIEPAEVAAPQSVTRENKSPGAPTTTKIGSAAKEYILEALALSDKTLEEIGPRYSEHLKLLWSRREVKFDGTRYYL